MKQEPKIIKALLISFFSIGVVMLLLTLFVQYTQIQTKVISLAKNEVKYLVKDLQHSKDLHHAQTILEETNFLYIALYDKKNIPVFEKEKGEYKEVVKELMSIDHHVTTRKQEGIEERVIHNQIRNIFYFEFKVPLDIQNFQGYLRGMYQISPGEMHAIYESLLYSVFGVLITVFITTLLLYPIIIYLNKAYIHQSEKLLHANLEIMSVLGGAIAKRDNETNAHNYRVTLYTIAFGEKLGLDAKSMMGLTKGAFLHDVGKIGVSDTILLKPSKLTEDEFKQMKKHVEYGVEIIAKSQWLSDGVDVVAYHHERYDGKGYKKGLVGEAIPLHARIFMICDVFDALTSVRPYKEAIAFEKVMEMIHARAGSHFDPTLVQVFSSFIADVYEEVALVESEEKLQEMLDKKLEYFRI